jgi:lysozyme family protein
MIPPLLAATPDRFRECLAFTLMYEGGRSNDPKDPGGRTNYGITQGTYNNWRASHGLRDQSVYLITPVDRDNIYRRDYWEAAGCDSLPRGVDLCIFDLAVNSGVSRAHKMRPLVAELPPDRAIREICVQRLSFLHALRSWSRFGRGWGRRVAACEVLAIKMAGANIKEAAAVASSKAVLHEPTVQGLLVFGGSAAALSVAFSTDLSGIAAASVIAVSTAAILTIPAFNQWRFTQRAKLLTTVADEQKKAEIAAGLARTVMLAKSIAADKQAGEIGKTK